MPRNISTYIANIITDRVLGQICSSRLVQPILLHGLHNSFLCLFLISFANLIDMFLSIRIIDNNIGHQLRIPFNSFLSIFVLFQFILRILFLNPIDIHFFELSQLNIHSLFVLLLLNEQIHLLSPF